MVLDWGLCRHKEAISTLLGIKHLVVAVNKMDLVWLSSEARFDEIRQSYLTLLNSRRWATSDIRFVPLSALEGITSPPQSANMPCTAGLTLLEVLETVEIQRGR